MTEAKKNLPPAAGSGRKKGVKNRVTVLLKEAIEQSFDRVGGVDYLVKMADDEPKAYMALLGKVLPNKIEADINVFQGEALIAKLQAGRASAVQQLERKRRRGTRAVH